MATKHASQARSGTVKRRYRARNWSEYDPALVSRGSLPVWFCEASRRRRRYAYTAKGRGELGRHSDLAIQTCLTIKTLFRLPYRATEGRIGSRS
jgi:hypothetical protein